jgi:hypothetical protein
MPLPRRHRLSPAEALAALYIDFEGRKDRAPILLGWAGPGGRSFRSRVQQILLDQRFAPLHRPSDPAISSLSDIIETLLARAEAEDRLIVAWSEHELRQVHQHCSVEVAARFESRFVNARKLAVRCSASRPLEQRPAGHRLVDYLALVGYPLPDEAGPGRVGATIGLIERALARASADRPVHLTANQVRRFAQLRAHNRHDCLGMRRVCRLAAAGLERAAVRARRRARRPVTGPGGPTKRPAARNLTRPAAGGPSSQKRETGQNPVTRSPA